MKTFVCVITLTWLVSVMGYQPEDKCIGEFQYCKNNGECTLFECNSTDTPHCTHGEYRCPISNHCVKGAEAYEECPGLKGTHLDHTLSTEERVSKLIAVANITEMISQLTNAAPALERLGIPAYNWLSDDEHGVRGWESTYFPDGPGLGASFDKELLFEVGEVVGKEARAKHNYLTHTTGMRDNAFNGDGITVYGPNMNLVKDPRWGRAQEVYSEDPKLSSDLTMGYVNGIQGAYPNATQKDKTYMQAGACCKHYVAYDLEGNGPLPSRVFFDANVSTRSFWEHYMPVFHSCIVTSKAMHTMCSYNSMNGIPTCGDAQLLNGVLREDWHWDGFVVSDYDAYANIYSTHHYTKDMEHAAAVGMNAGLDQEGGGTKAISQLQQALDDGLTVAENIEKAFGRLMRMRIRLGMFDPPTLMSYNYLGKADLQTKYSTSVNRRAAAKGMVLLLNKNTSRGKPVLPLDVSMLQDKESVLVAGPNANNANNTFGNYACDYGNCSTNVTSILDGIKNADTGLNKGQVVFEAGCNTTNCSQTDYTKAQTIAKQAKVSFVVLGTLGWDRLDAGDNANPNAWEREGHDRISLALPSNQYKLAEALSPEKTGTPLVCVLIHGGSIILGSLLDSCTAIVDAYFPGQQGGAGFADVVFGKVSPAGRSPQTYYKSDEELPPLGNMDLYAKNGTTYRYYTGKPVVPFGFGLSYSTFKYSDLAVDKKQLSPCDTLHVTVSVTNTGQVDSDEVVQVYIKTPETTVPAPRIRMADFTRVFVEKGSTKQVRLAVTPKYFYVVKENGKSDFWDPSLMVEKGTLQIFVGGGQPDYTEGVLKTSVDITASAKLSKLYSC
eukprot:m.96434 g.96434  ORF g.96434 m.96434 type:complete len:835 (+) comp13547_c1_seq2:207-2711(+)